MTICRHVYSVNHAAAHKSFGEQCPYPAFYERTRSTTETSQASPKRELLIDDHGLCIFHSQDLAWKRKSQFESEFLQLLKLLDGDGAYTAYDFSEFVFVGNDVTPTSGHKEPVFRLVDVTLQKQAYFTGASFIDSVAIEHVRFSNVTFDNTSFAQDLKVVATSFHGIDFNRAAFRRLALFTRVEFLNYALFHNTQFTGTTGGYVVKFEESRFEGITDFSQARFTLGDESAVGFVKVQFEDFADFKMAVFQGQVVFSDVSFAGVTEFIDTSFDIARSSARYRGAAVEFNQIDVAIQAVLTFRSTDALNKIFSHDVQMSFRQDPAGRIEFENVNFSKLTLASRERLMRLAQSGKVEIGSGCIKYRHQTEIRKLAVSENNAPLVIELCHTFSNYFTVSSGLNLGFEVVDRSKTELSFFYFTDEDISEATFLHRLAATERSLWNLLATRSDLQLLAAEAPATEALSTGTGNALINAVDGVSALLGTMFRVAIRIALGTWKQSDTTALLGAIRFNNDEGAQHRALRFHQIMVTNYTHRILAEINVRQNMGLPPMAVADHVDFAILTALEVERRAVCTAFGLRDTDRMKKEDGRFYWRGRLAVRDGEVYQLVVAQPIDMGNVDAALLAADVLRQWSPRAALFVGIAASTDPDKISLGDVVVAQSVWYYEHGKVTLAGNRPQPEMIQADSGLLKHLVGLADWEGDVIVPRPDRTQAKPKVSKGVIASGEKVIADAAIRDQIASGHRKILALEMEGYGFSRAVWQSVGHVRHLVIRGICDTGSSAKDDRWHEYAASAAAAFARHFILDRPLSSAEPKNAT